MRLMISVDLARSLRTAGLPWEPANGDWFIVDAAELLEDRFVLATMTVDVKRFGTGTVLGFNGTTEWALDSVPLADALWLPGEGQLRECLGGAFTGLAPADGGWCVELWVDGAPITFTSAEVGDAYGRAVLHLLTR